MDLRPVALLLALALGASACAADDTGGAVEDQAIDGSPSEPAPAPTTTPVPDPEPTADPTTTASPGPADPPPAGQPTATAAPVPTATPDPASFTVELPERVAVELTPLVSVSLPIAMASRPGSDALYVATKGGLVHEVEVSGDEGSIVRTILNLEGQVSDGNEQGLLGLVFSPDGSTLYVDYTDLDGDTVVGAQAFDGDILVDDTSVVPILQVDQPRANHNGGGLAFGPDGHLYISLGDGGGAGDPFDTGQDPFSLLGTILRIAPQPLDGEFAYAVPADNPFVNGGGAPEVFVWGARNPWRFSFDRLTGDLWIADVGQDRLEELVVAYAADGGGRGANLGWPDVEGTAPFRGAGPPADDYLGPIHEYGRADGCSITGGYLYRGSAIPELVGHYVFGDYCTSRLWGFASSRSQGALGRFDIMGATLPRETLASFGEGPDGELYVLSFDGTVYRIDPVE